MTVRVTPGIVGKQALFAFNATLESTVAINARRTEYSQISRKHKTLHSKSARLVDNVWKSGKFIKIIN